MGFKRSWVRIPPARFLDLPEILFSLKRFQRDGGVAEFPKERRNRYGDGIVSSFVLQLTAERVDKSIFTLTTSPPNL